jgi:hypothetical protein
MPNSHIRTAPNMSDAAIDYERVSALLGVKIESQDEFKHVRETDIPKDIALADRVYLGKLIAANNETSAGKRTHKTSKEALSTPPPTAVEDPNDPDPHHDQGAVLREQYSTLFDGNKYWDAYQALLNALACFQKMPEGRLKLRDLTGCFYNLFSVSVKLRYTYRLRSASASDSCVGSSIFFCFLPCTVYRCVRIAQISEQWVDDATLIGYYNEAESFAGKLYDHVKTANNITMSTDKNTVSDQARKDIAYSYNIKGCLKYYNEETPYDLACCGCCFFPKGTYINNCVTATAVGHFKAATEWDPTNTTYSTNYNAADAYMKKPVVNVHVTQYRS